MEKKGFVYKVGHAIGVVLAICASLCLCGAIVAVTIKFLSLLFK